MVSGTQLGAYRIVQRIGAGGMGEVWLGEHAMLGRRAAIKVLHAEYSGRSEIVTRFFNEARAATAIADPGIVQIFDFGIHVDGSAYIVMELLDGETVEKRLRRSGVLPIPDALRIMRQVASSLGAAHARGIVHRDLKPENIFIVPDPEIPGGERTKILDFGIAKLVGDQTVKTNTSAVMGTPTFMSPEQCRGAGHVDQRSDIYSLGCVLYVLMTGHPPFDAEGIGEIIAMHLREPPPVPSHRAAWIPPDVDQLVLRCLDKDPAKRFASGTELATAISAVQSRATPLPMAAVHSPSAAHHRQVTPPNTTLSATAGSRSTAKPPERSWRWLVGAGIGALSLAGAIVWIVVQPGSSDKSPTPPVQPAQATLPTTTLPDAAAPPDASSESVAADRIKQLLTSFAAWSREHQGAPCPDAAALGYVQDPWGHSLQITCTDQPADQAVGVVSLGADGQLHTGDDIASWRLGHDITSLVDGPRWVVTPTKETSKSTARIEHKPRQQSSSAAPKAAGTSAPPSVPAPAAASSEPAKPPTPAVGSDGIIRTR